MIINSNRSEEQQKTIQYIRNLTHSFAPVLNKFQDSDSLALSHSEPDSLNLQIQPRKKKKQQKSKQARAYVSPYKQSSISIKKITEKQRKKEIALSPFVIQKMITPQKQKKSLSKSSKKVSSPAKYLQIPHRFLNQRKKLTQKVTLEARQIYSKESLNRCQFSNRQKKEKWADFLLRQRKWESQKQDKIMIAEQILLQKQKEEHQPFFAPKQYPKMNIDDHIRLVNRKKIQLKQELKSHLLNYYTWQNPYSSRSPERPQSKSPQFAQKSKIQQRDRSKTSNFSRQKMIQIKNNKQIKFVVEKNR